MGCAVKRLRLHSKETGNMAAVSMEELRNDAARMTVWQRHRFLLLIAGVITLSFVMVVIGMYIYNTSGAAQVDLSRPGYQSVQKEASRDTTDDSFASTGKLDKDAFDSFDNMYAEHARQVVGVDSFDPRAVDPDTLLFGASTN